MQRRAAFFLLACIPFFTACAIIPISHPTQPVVSKLSSPPVTLKRAQFLMGTLVELTAVAPSDAIAQDRKSTRLNSSHTVISYAVFCLKKKKKREETTKQNKHTTIR